MLGRKRHIAVDTDGRLLMINLTSADISDSAGAQTELKTAITLCESDNDQPCANDARRLLR